MEKVNIQRIEIDDPLYQQERDLRNRILLRPIGIPDFGWENGKLFRVAEMSISGEDTISFTAQEYESSIQLI